jgi:hypothetical protein
MIIGMRTTLNIDDDVLAEIKRMAVARETTAGRVLSELARTALVNASPKRNGVRLLPEREGAEQVTPEMVNRLRDEEE